MEGLNTGQLVCPMLPMLPPVWYEAPTIALCVIRVRVLSYEIEQVEESVPSALGDMLRLSTEVICCASLPRFVTLGVIIERGAATHHSAQQPAPEWPPWEPTLDGTVISPVRVTPRSILHGSGVSN